MDAPGLEMDVKFARLIIGFTSSEIPANLINAIWKPACSIAADTQELS